MGPVTEGGADSSGAAPAVLAIDAGNSKTDVAVVDADGRVWGRGRGAGYAPYQLGQDAAVERIASLVEEVLRSAAGAGPVEHVAAYLANIDLPVEELHLRKEFEDRGWARTVTVGNDTFAVLRSGTGAPRGVAVVCGAGINCVGLLPDGRTARFPALGRMTGDWGGGLGLMEEVMWSSVRAEDGRGPATALADATAGHFGLDSATAVAEAVHLGELPSERLHELVPLLFRIADAGDPVAGEVVERQAKEIAVMAVTALGRLDLLAEEADVVLGGGVLAAQPPMLMAAVSRLILHSAPRAVLRVAVDPPVVGAALLGLDRLRADGRAPEDPTGKAEHLLRTGWGRTA
ncbi:N-acetylglucosamine kinase [Embleya sp. NPDC050493]|uniref:N-acetylglucosamine kinase n=1 Tax=Embleya sp. NPDC050493 TaxID=3363989 RepID=UPI0037B663AF